MENQNNKATVEMGKGAGIFDYHIHMEIPLEESSIEAVKQYLELAENEKISGNETSCMLLDNKLIVLYKVALIRE